jgi:CheY-like chemotaxis protein
MVDECRLEVDPGEDLLPELVPLPGIRVLVADLHPVIADVCAMILNQSGFSALPAHDVTQAVTLAHENVVDVAFIELLIGDTNGIDAATRILALRPHCRIVIWTGQREPVLSWVRREAEEQFGGCDLLCKPIHPRNIMHIARGARIPPECAIPSEPRNAIAAPARPEDYLTGSRLHEWFHYARERVLRARRDQDLILPKPETKGQRLDDDTARVFLRITGGDKQKARQLASQQGFTF